MSSTRYRRRRRSLSNQLLGKVLTIEQEKLSRFDGRWTGV